MSPREVQTNAWIVTKDGEILTRNANNAILNGITGRRFWRQPALPGYVVPNVHSPLRKPCSRQKHFDQHTDQLRIARRFDRRAGDIGDGIPGPFSLRLRKAYEAALS